MNAVVPAPADRKSRPFRVAVVLVLVSVSLLAWRPLTDWQQRRFAMQLAQRAMESESPTQAELSVDELWPLGLAATAPLARMAAMQRPEIAAAAQQGLANQLTAWEIELDAVGDTASFAAKLAELSGLIAATADQLDATGQLWAKKLSRRMTLDCEALNAQEAWSILRACDCISSLRAAPTGRTAATVAAAEARPLRTPTVASNGEQLMGRSTPIVPGMPLAALGGAELAPPSSPSSQLAVIMSIPPPAAAPIVDSPIPAVNGPAANPLRPNGPAAELSEAPREASSRPAAVANSAVPVPTIAPADPIDVPSPLDMRRLRQRLRGQSDAQLILLAESGPRFEAAAARELLRIRGYTAELLQMTRELRQLPANERRAALDRAGSLPAAEARSLLRWFLADEDAEVRLQALTLLATTGDPQLEQLARQRAVEDADPRVADLAAKLMQ